MKPLIKSIYPSEGIKKYLFFLIKDRRCKNFWLAIIFSNTIVLTINYHRSSQIYSSILGINYVSYNFKDLFNDIFIGIFLVEILVRLAAKDFKIYFEDYINRIDLLGIWICIANLIIRNNHDIDFYVRKVLNATCIAF